AGGGSQGSLSVDCSRARVGPPGDRVANRAALGARSRRRYRRRTTLDRAAFVDLRQSSLAALAGGGFGRQRSLPSTSWANPHRRRPAIRACLVSRSGRVVLAAMV